MTEIVQTDYIANGTFNRCYHQGMRAAGFVLTGGNSTRMGRDKALLALDGEHLVHSIATTLSEVTAPVTLVGQPERYAHLGWPSLADLWSGSGPLGGLEAALTATQAELNLIVACDMPALRSDFLRALLKAAEGSTALCNVAQDEEGRIHPLCAVYRKSCLPFVVRALEKRQWRLTALVEALGAERLQAVSGLENVNTPQEWSEWQDTRMHAGRHEHTGK